MQQSVVKKLGIGCRLALCALCFGAMVAGCGQRGPLSLPGAAAVDVPPAPAEESDDEQQRER